MTDWKKLIENATEKSLIVAKNQRDVEYNRGKIVGARLPSELLLLAVEALENYGNEQHFVRGSADGASGACCKITEEGGRSARETLDQIRSKLEGAE